jgi:hypothetical protein
VNFTCKIFVDRFPKVCGTVKIGLGKLGVPNFPFKRSQSKKSRITEGIRAKIRASRRETSFQLIRIRLDNAEFILFALTVFGTPTYTGQQILCNFPISAGQREEGRAVKIHSRITAVTRAIPVINALRYN